MRWKTIPPTGWFNRRRRIPNPELPCLEKPSVYPWGTTPAKTSVLLIFFLAGFLSAHPSWAATPIYRSVGPANTSPLATGAANAMVISGSTATFASPLPDKIGVGDVIQYDSDDNGSLDSLGFIHGRTDSTHYTVKDGNGAAPMPTAAADQDWSIFRAYASLANAEAGIENTGIAPGLRNFDDWTAGGDATTDDVGKDLVAADQQWNIACYADATDTTPVLISDWTTAALNYLQIYTPCEPNEVGIGQRHIGKWDNEKYCLTGFLSAPTNSLIEVRNGYTRIEGLQLTYSFSNAYWYQIRSASGVTELMISNTIFNGSNCGYGDLGLEIDYTVNNMVIKAYNNIFYGFTSTVNRAIHFAGTGNNSNYLFAYNNTLYGNTAGIVQQDGVLIAKNNLANNNGTDYLGAFDAASSNNISQDDTSPNIACRNQTVFFVNAAANDFHLAGADTAAKDNGVNLSSDADLRFSIDIDNQTRFGAWDIGADEYTASMVPSPTSTPSSTFSPTPSPSPADLPFFRILNPILHPGRQPLIRLAVSLEQAGPLRVEVYNLSGRSVARIADGMFSAGYHELAWDGGSAGSGLYLLRAKTNSQEAKGKVAVIR